MTNYDPLSDVQNAILTALFDADGRKRFAEVNLSVEMDRPPEQLELVATDGNGKFPVEQRKGSKRLIVTVYASIPG